MRYILFAILMTMVAGASGADLDVALEKALAGAGWKNPLREKLQRAVDVRLVRIEAMGIEACGLFTGQVHVARSAREVQGLSEKLKPGDQLVLAGTNWTDGRFSFEGRGTMEAPILIRAEKPGSVVFSGAAGVTFFGAHLVITGLEFKHVTSVKNGNVVFRLGNGRERPAEWCIVNRIKIEDCNSASPEDWSRVKVWYLTTDYGHDNTVANSTFAGLRHIGQMIGAAELPVEGWQRLHILNNHFGPRPYLDEQNGYEIIQIGWSALKAKGTGSLIAGNIFEKCDGEAEIITVKASDVFVRSNTFAGCQGALVLREANRVLVQGNVFDGRGQTNTGGLRICGGDHVIVGNTFRDLKKPRDYYYRTISLMAASAETPEEDIEGYGRARNILIAGNRFERCDNLIAAGIYPRPKYPLLPQNILARGDVIVGAKTNGVFDYVAPGGEGGVREMGTVISDQ